MGQRGDEKCSCMSRKIAVDSKALTVHLSRELCAQNETVFILSQMHCDINGAAAHYEEAILLCICF